MNLSYRFLGSWIARHLSLSLNIILTPPPSLPYHISDDVSDIGTWGGGAQSQVLSHIISPSHPIQQVNVILLISLSPCSLYTNRRQADGGKFTKLTDSVRSLKPATTNNHNYNNSPKKEKKKSQIAKELTRTRTSSLKAHSYPQKGERKG